MNDTQLSQQLAFVIAQRHQDEATVLGQAVRDGIQSLYRETLTEAYLLGQVTREMVLKEFDERPSGLILPFGKVAKRFDGERVWRVVWKIVRGLFFKEIGQVLPDDLPIKYEILSPGEKPPSEYDIVHTAPPLGQYPAVFDYRYVGIPEKMYLWAMLFWDRIIMFVGFHLPGCTCRICTNNHIGDAKMITPLSVGKTRHRHEP